MATRVDPEGTKNPDGERETIEQSGALVAERITSVARRSSPYPGGARRGAWDQRIRSEISVDAKI
jgi:hypothetical protein